MTQLENENIDQNTKYKDGVNKNARLMVRNISFKASEDSLKKYFSKFGTVEEVKLLRKPDGKLVGCGFVHFTHVPMANEALAATNKKPFLDRPLHVSWAIPKHKYAEQNSDTKKDSRFVKEETQNEETKPLERKEQKKQQRLNRNARLIVRNISFKATEETLTEHFKPYGDIIEVKLLKKPDGKLVGCAFVHFKNVPMAKKALLNTNMKPFLGRPISVDWAVAKDKYMQHVINQQMEMQEKVKTEDSDSDDDVPMNISSETLKEEIKSESEDEASDKEAASDDSKSDVASDDSKSDTDDDDEESDDVNEEGSRDEEEEDAMDEDDKASQSDVTERKRIKLNDAEDGCTVFVTNISFTVDNDQLQAFAERTGPVRYALICVDKLTEHSKGSGFIKFQNKEDADKFLSLPAAQLKLEGQVLVPKPALKKENLQKDKKNERKDNRNLYLVKEGVIVAGTKAAEGVSASDMAKRLALERSKTQMLKNLNRFVSRYRLVVSNLPPHYDDPQLRRLCTQGRAAPTEARVMRDLRAMPALGGKYPSKGYGFVMFTRHEDALACLRRLNNNPDIFDKNNRPIVSFSIEDRTALNARKKRLEKSIANNPLAQKHTDNAQSNKRNRKRKNKAPPEESYVKKARLTKKVSDKNDSNVGRFVKRPVDESDRQFSGLTAKEGTPHKMRSFHKLKAQADLHRETVKKEKKKSKHTQRIKMAAKERIKQPKQKINKNKVGKGRRNKNRKRFFNDDL